MRGENLSAWLFTNFHHNDPISDRILEVPPEVTNSRPWIYLLHQDKSAEKLVHTIENKILDHLHGRKRVYASRQQFLTHLREMATGSAEVACHFSSPDAPTNPVHAPRGAWCLIPKVRLEAGAVYRVAAKIPGRDTVLEWTFRTGK